MSRRGRVDGASGPGGGYAGGPATSAGTGFQHDLSAWIETLILAERDATPPWGIPATVTLEAVAGETDHSVDDLAVETSGPERVAVQAKTGLTLSEPPAAPATGTGATRRPRQPPLGSAIGQAVRAYLDDPTPGVSPPAFPPYVFAAGPGSSQPITEHLRKALDRLRTIPPGAALTSAAVNAGERGALDAAVAHVNAAWQQACGAVPADDDVRAVLTRVQIDGRAAQDHAVYVREAKQLLRTAVLEDPTQADLAWDALVVLAQRLAANRLRADRETIRRELTGKGIRLRAARSYRADVNALKEHSRRVRDRLADYAAIQLGTAEVRVARTIAPALRAAALQGSLLIVGPPGAGKSGALVTAADELQAAGHDVVSLDASAVNAQSAGTLGGDLGLTHDVVDVLANWPGGAPAFLLIDALDAARGETAAHTFRSLIAAVRARAPRWHVVASVREYELRHNPDLARLFPCLPDDGGGAPFAAPALRRIRHVWVGDFDPQELSQIGGQAAALAELVAAAPGALATLLRNPFNLRLAAELLEAGTTAAELRGVRLRVELLERYWDARVIVAGDYRDADARESVLRAACGRMVERRRLVVDRADLAANPAASRPLTETLAAHVLREFAASATAVPDRAVLTFSHHVLFDYAVARLLLRGTPDALAARLTSDPDLVLMVRPSIVLHFQWLWARDPGDVAHGAFWDTVFATFRASGMRATAQLIGPAVAAELARAVTDLAPLTTALHAADANTRTAAEHALRHIVGALVAAPLPVAPSVAEGAR